jgi:hypothetical protein
VDEQEHPRPHIAEDVGEVNHPRIEEILAHTRKRKYDESSLVASLLDLETINIADHLPSQAVISKLVDYFCVTFHHWIPYLHKKRLQTRAGNGSRDPHLDLILHAVVAASIRHLDRNVLYLDDDQVLHQIKVSRFIVETYALKDVSLTSLRALIIIVFDYLNSGQMKKAWPLIGSLTRTVDYLQLTVEPTASQNGALMNPLKLVQPTDDWTELEERRRVFWVIFLLDRFCSVSTGWNTSLTSEDVHRRLPADGGYFTREEPVTTPYFGIWNKSSARIGKSLAHVPAQYNEDDPVIDQAQGTSPGSTSGLIDSSKLGAFAYCIEATESLSQVTTFFLQQRINWQDKEHAINWLTRFKELDLRLVHWKLFLPPRWKDSNISEDTAVINMDPNLTLAHITHNTSMILLHHPIAYPPKGWCNYVALPKECSAQTCELAAVETSNIVTKFLDNQDFFVNVQFAFCAFVAAKALLFEHSTTRRSVRPEFQVLVRSLWEMSRRWSRSLFPNDNGDSTDQAGKYARHLEYLHDSCQRDSRYKFDLYDHINHTMSSQDLISPTQTATPPHSVGTPLRDRRQSSHVRRPNNLSGSHPALPPIGAANTPSLSSIMYNNPIQSPTAFQTQTQQQSPSGIASSYMPPPARTNSFDQTQHGYPSTPGPPILHSQIQALNGAANGNTVQDESLLSLSDAFMDSQFLGLDRVITFEDANFFLPGDGFRWQ